MTTEPQPSTSVGLSGALKTLRKGTKRAKLTVKREAGDEWYYHDDQHVIRPLHGPSWDSVAVTGDDPATVRMLELMVFMVNHADEIIEALNTCEQTIWAVEEGD